MEPLDRSEFPWTHALDRLPEAKAILRLVSKASLDYALIEPNDNILVACSGGKDSYALAWALWQSRKRLPFHFDFTCVNIDQGFGGFKQDVVGDYLKRQGAPVQLVQSNAGEVCRVKFPAGEDVCWMCARLRRGVLYTTAKRLGCNKLALGHHADDTIETLFLNLFYTSQLKAMPPRLVTEDKALVVIRPLIYVYEETTRDFARKMGMPIVDCDCEHKEHLGDSRRLMVKQLIGELSARVPELRNHLLASLGRVRLSHLLDRRRLDLGKPGE